jgi:hypothetical protein
MAASMSAAVIYRSIEQLRGTILMDEAEKLEGREKDIQGEIMGILNSGYKVSGSAWRCEGDDHRTTRFSTFSPKLFASIRTPDGVLADRSIQLRTLRTNQRLPSFNSDRLRPCFEEIRDRLYIYAMQNAHRLSELFDSNPIVPEIRDREEELWVPIFTTARLIDAESSDGNPSTPEEASLYEQMKNLAIDIKANKDQEDEEVDWNSKCLKVILAFIRRENTLSPISASDPREYSASEMLHYVKNGLQKERFTINGLTRVLQTLGIIVDRIKEIRRRHRDRYYLIDPKRLEEARSRFLTSEPDDDSDGISDVKPPI